MATEPTEVGTATELAGLGGSETFCGSTVRLPISCSPSPPRKEDLAQGDASPRSSSPNRKVGYGIDQVLSGLLQALGCVCDVDEVIVTISKLPVESTSTEWTP